MPVKQSAGHVTTRALAPDLARGVMLLAIAMAHAPLFVETVGRGSALANEIAGFFHLLVVHNHARPMFAFLFGYAMVQLLAAQQRRGQDWAAIRKLQRRRGWWLVAIGFAHVAVLVPIDILAVYGLAAVLLAGLLRAKDSALLWTAAITLPAATLTAGSGLWLAMSQGVSTYSQGSIAADGAGFLDLLATRLQGWPYVLAAGVISVVPGVLLGMWAARRRILDDPLHHRSFLTRTATITTALSVAGALPAALIQAGAWARPPGAALWLAALAQPFTGYLGGIGLAAIVGLVAIAAGRRRNRLTTAVEALGQRSMSLYLFQSVAFLAVFPSYGLGLQDDLGLAGAMGVATATWLASLGIAELMRRAAHRGPAEILLRRLANPWPFSRR
ncbi:DUF418 domain-containing protein [Nonomuraea zeae]|uniref:DUF418 domain-containing protein n=1 Tax=Nonomuraea zeae TaxID=1642303 RepID=A0A5S4GIX7_9ACTN|nr:DUF418 domain-containing protein [Nonomuraea zeae]TMR32464.1 DUF418 domain-containing protein [Nonomuraea zeae]